MSVKVINKVGIKHPRDNPSYIRYPRRTVDSQIIFISLSRSSVAKVPMKTEMFKEKSERA